MNPIDELVPRLAAWARTERAWARVDLARCKEAVLRRTPSAASLVAAAQPPVGEAPDELLAALARQAQRSRAPVWSALLVVASSRWLGRLARRFEAAAGSPADSASLVVTALLTIAGRARRARHVTRVWLKLQTQRQAIAWLRNQGRIEGGPPDERRARRRPPPGRADLRARRLAQLGAQEAP